MAKLLKKLFLIALVVSLVITAFMACSSNNPADDDDDDDGKVATKKPASSIETDPTDVQGTTAPESSGVSGNDSPNESSQNQGIITQAPCEHNYGEWVTSSYPSCSRTGFTIWRRNRSVARRLQ